MPGFPRDAQVALLQGRLPGVAILFAEFGEVLLRARVNLILDPNHPAVALHPDYMPPLAVKLLQRDAIRQRGSEPH